jgi:hypothetical protein
MGLGTTRNKSGPCCDPLKSETNKKNTWCRLSVTTLVGSFTAS